MYYCAGWNIVVPLCKKQARSLTGPLLTSVALLLVCFLFAMEYVTNLLFGEEEKPFHTLVAHGNLEGIKKALAKNPSIVNLPTENMMNGQVVSYPMFDALYWFIIYDQQQNERDNAEKQRDVFYYLLSLSPTSI